jgi:hypothetical protein
MSEPLNISQIIDLVKESNKEFDSEVFIPSMQKNVHVKPMTASHLKSIIKTSVAGVFANNLFNQIVFVIFKDILDGVPTVNINSYDKIALLLQLRNKNVKSTIDAEVSDDEGGKKTVTVELSDIIARIKAETFQFQDEIVTDTSYEITLNYPSIEQEFLFDRYFEQTKISKIDENDKKALRELFGPLFIQELAQYIKMVKIKDTEINFISLPVQDRISIVESLSGQVISAIITKIDEVFGNKISKVLKVEREIDGKTYTGQIEMNASIFA